MTTDAYALIDLPNPQGKVVHAHSSDAELGKIIAADIALHAGPNNMLRALSCLDIAANSTTWLKQGRQSYLDSFEVPMQPGAVDMGQIMHYLRRCLPGDAVLTNGAGNFAVWLNKLFKFGENQRLLAPQSGAMGFGVPAAIACKLVEPERTVICFAGDGDFQMNCQELGTAMQYGARPIILIINNGSYGTIRMHQEQHYPARVSGTDIENPDFVTLAKAYGFMSVLIEKTEYFYPAFEQALVSKSGAVLDIHIDIESLTPRRTLSQFRSSAG